MQVSLDRVAVFVDGDNIASRHAPAVLKHSSDYGRADVVRVYGNGSCLNGWAECAGFEFIFSGPGKNSADILLSIDATELTLARRFDSVIIASSDGDFCHLAKRLRARGILVVGLGEAKSPEAFRRACSEFREIREEIELDQTIRKVIATHSTNGTGMRIAQLSTIMHSKHRVKISKQPERTWRAYLAKRPNLYDLDPRGPNAKVRFRPDGFDQKT